MIEITPVQSEGVAGGSVFSDAVFLIRSTYALGSAYVSGMNAVGATLSNYYGNDMTLQIVAAGNMTA